MKPITYVSQIQETYELIDLDMEETLAVQIMTPDEARRRNSVLRANNEPFRWVKSEGWEIE